MGRIRVRRLKSAQVSGPFCASLSGADADFNRGISAYIINDINRAKKRGETAKGREYLGFHLDYILRYRRHKIILYVPAKIHT
jgi:hypothetical protein